MNFIQQAFKGENHWGWYLLSIILILFGWQFFGAIPLLIAVIFYLSDMGEFMKAAEDNFMSTGMDTNLFLFLMIVSFAFGLVALFASVKWIHKRSATSLVTSRNKVDWSRVFYAFIIWAVIVAAITFFGILESPENYTWNFKPIPFFILLLISFLFLPLQTSFEELFFRGYLMQGIGRLFKNAWVPLLFTSITFGLLHGMNPEVEKLGYISMVYYIGTGLFLGIITLMDEGTELALGFHAANNIIAALIVTTDWTALQTHALYVDSSEPSVGYEMFLPVLVLYPIVYVIFSRKYNWTNWQGKLFGSIEKPIEISE